MCGGKTGLTRLEPQNPPAETDSPLEAVRARTAAAESGVVRLVDDDLDKRNGRR
jgi:hypothetical protein